MVVAHDITPFGFAEGEDAPPPSRFLRREDRDIDLDLGAVRGVVHDTGTDIARWRAEQAQAGAEREAAAEGLEVRADDAAQEACSLVSPDRLGLA